MFAALAFVATGDFDVFVLFAGAGRATGVSTKDLLLTGFELALLFKSLQRK